MIDGLSTEELDARFDGIFHSGAARDKLIANVRFMTGKVGGSSLTFFDLFTDMMDGAVTGTFTITVPKVEERFFSETETLQAPH